MSGELGSYTEADLLHHLRVVEYAGDPILEYVLSQFERPLPEGEIVYHYASKSGFEGIVRSGNLWASPAHTLNDQDEIHDGARAIEDVLRNAKNDLENLNSLSDSVPDADRFVKAMAASYFHSNYSPPKIYQIYTVSFSEDGDSSSQWLSYVEDDGDSKVKGRGFALGFSGVHLRNASQFLGYRFNSCRYDREQKRAIVNGALDSAVLYIKRMLQAKLTLGASVEWAEQKFFYAMLPMLPFFKNHTFYSEREWRVAIFEDNKSEWERDKVEVWGGTREILKFSLRSSQKNFSHFSYLPLFHVIAGCGITEKEVADARAMLDEHGYPHVPIVRSECRLR